MDCSPPVLVPELDVPPSMSEPELDNSPVLEPGLELIPPLEEEEPPPSSIELIMPPAAWLPVLLVLPDPI